MNQPDFDLESYVPYLLNRVGTALVDRFVGGLKDFDLTLPMWRVMAILYRRGPTRFGVLGGLSLIELPTLSRILAAMSDRGLVARVRSDVDGRGTLVQLSAEGRASVEGLIPWAESVAQFTLDGLSADEAEFFKRLLLRVSRHVAPSPKMPETD
ncbi:MAG: MarR family winged helix-turn-helix transcriptional regulator [Bradyrhizobium sp.]